ncbi:MAG: radical SAM protein [Kastovskya adunca ATA6-11-RM4]|jgi:MoaA/NifB/PqqE/SkfB family radical SAM enzyme|nr:radical SAM protein [Kastovskya adunca ATA6-11-RM4]
MLSKHPRFVNWHYTYNCNFNCDHCYSRSPSYPEDLSVVDYQLIVEKLIDAQIFKVAFGGGEPLTRADLVHTVKRLSEAGIFTHITTNGWLVDTAMAEKLKEAGLGTLSFSIDSPFLKYHDELRNKSGSYSRVLEGIRSANRVGLKVHFSTTITVENHEYISEFVSLAEQELISEINFKLFRAAGNGLVLKDRFSIKQDVLEDLIARVDDSRKKSKVKISMYGSESGENCSCGNTTLTLRPNGDLVICPYSGDSIGNILKQTLSEVWLNSSELSERRREPNKCFGKEDNQWPINSDREKMPLKPYTEKLMQKQVAKGIVHANKA